MGPGGAVSEPVQPELLIPAQPDVVALSGDAVVPAGQGHVASDLLSMPDYRQPPGCVPGYLSFGHKASFVWRPKCQRPVSVSDCLPTKLLITRGRDSRTVGRGAELVSPLFLGD